MRQKLLVFVFLSLAGVWLGLQVIDAIEVLTEIVAR